MTTVWSVFFVFIAAFLGGFIFWGPGVPAAAFLKAGNFANGGPMVVNEGNFVLSSSDFGQEANISSDGNSAQFIDDTTILAPGEPLTNLIPERSGLKRYKVRSGDTLSLLAAQFGIDIETLRLANPGLQSLLRPGEELVVLPVSGLLYQTKEGDSFEFVANLYNISADLIKKYNPDYQRLFDGTGNAVILPGAKPLSGGTAFGFAGTLPDFKNYFILPARGWNWGILHDNNAVDIADQCGSPIYASAEGLVVEESSDGYWNDGYGNYVLIEHPNSVKTRYAHNLKNLVKVGDYVAQGQEIALMGSTGKNDGPAGCHLHFEIIGAKNPFAFK